MGHGDPPIRHHDHQISQAQLKARVPAHAQNDNLPVEVPSFEQIFDRDESMHLFIITCHPRVCTRALMLTSSSRAERAASEVRRMPIQRNLARRRIGGRQPAVGGTPDAADTASSANEQRGRCQADKSKQQRVLDEVLALFFLEKTE